MGKYENQSKKRQTIAELASVVLSIVDLGILTALKQTAPDELANKIAWLSHMACAVLNRGTVRKSRAWLAAFIAAYPWARHR